MALKNKIKDIIVAVEEIAPHEKLCNYCIKDCYKVRKVTKCKYFKRDYEFITCKGVGKFVYIGSGEIQGFVKVYKRGRIINWRKRNE